MAAIKVDCSVCRGQGYDVEIACPDCRGSGYNPKDDNPFAQCHSCNGSKLVEVDVCPRCNGSKQIEVEYESTNNPALLKDGAYKCSNCINPASHILVDYYHQVLDPGILFCSHHAFYNGRESCPCCYEYDIDFEGQDYLPTYPSGTLDGQGCCSEHP